MSRSLRCLVPIGPLGRASPGFQHPWINVVVCQTSSARGGGGGGDTKHIIRHYSIELRGSDKQLCDNHNCNGSIEGKLSPKDRDTVLYTQLLDYLCSRLLGC